MSGIFHFLFFLLLSPFIQCSLFHQQGVTLNLLSFFLAFISLTLFHHHHHHHHQGFCAFPLSFCCCNLFLTDCFHYYLTYHIIFSFTLSFLLTALFSNHQVISYNFLSFILVFSQIFSLFVIFLITLFFSFVALFF